MSVYDTIYRLNGTKEPVLAQSHKPNQTLQFCYKETIFCFPEIDHAVLEANVNPGASPRPQKEKGSPDLVHHPHPN